MTEKKVTSIEATGEVFTVQELIDALAKIEDKDKPIWVYSYDDESPANYINNYDDRVLII